MEDRFWQWSRVRESELRVTQFQVLGNRKMMKPLTEMNKMMTSLGPSC